MSNKQTYTTSGHLSFGAFIYCVFVCLVIKHMLGMFFFYYDFFQHTLKLKLGVFIYGPFGEHATRYLIFVKPEHLNECKSINSLK